MPFRTTIETHLALALLGQKRSWFVQASLNTFWGCHSLLKLSAGLWLVGFLQWRVKQPNKAPPHTEVDSAWHLLRLPQKSGKGSLGL